MQERRAIIFTESTSSIGLGHLRRCEALREILQQHKFHVQLVCNQSPLDYEKTLESYDIGVLDSYLQPLQAYEILARSTRAIFLDDTLRLPYPSATILNATMAALHLPYAQTYPNHTLWLGLGYALLRAPFCPPLPLREHNETIRQILLSFGGSAAAQHYFEVVETLLLKLCQDVRIVRIDPSTNPSAHEIRALMESSCLAVSAAGGTLTELAFCGTPTIACCIADNQRPNFFAWAQSGAVQACEGEVGSAEFAHNFSNAFACVQPKNKREILSTCAQNLVRECLWQSVKF